MTEEEVKRICDLMWQMDFDNGDVEKVRKALEKQMHFERDLHDEIFMKGYYPTDKPEELSKYHLFVPYKVVEQFIKGKE